MLATLMFPTRSGTTTRHGPTLPARRSSLFKGHQPVDCYRWGAKNNELTRDDSLPMTVTHRQTPLQPLGIGHVFAGDGMKPKT